MSDKDAEGVWVTGKGSKVGGIIKKCSGIIFSPRNLLATWFTSTYSCYLFFSHKKRRGKFFGSGSGSQVYELRQTL